MATSREPDLIGASEEPVDLTGSVTRARVAVRRDLSTSPRLESMARDRYLLQLEGIVGTGQPGNFHVLVGKVGSGTPPVAAGSFSTFGLESASDPSDNHGRLGLSKVLDITEIAAGLGLTREDRTNLEVSFERIPLLPSEEAESDRLEGAARPSPPPSIQIGQIKLFTK